MTKLQSALAAALNDRNGTATVEYALLTAMVAIAAVAAVSTAGIGVSSPFSLISTALQ